MAPRPIVGAPFGQLFQRISGNASPDSLSRRPHAVSSAHSHSDPKKDSGGPSVENEKSVPATFTAAAFGAFALPLQSQAVQTHTVQSVMSMELLVPELVKKIAWGGDKERATARLVLGKGALDGTSVTIHSDRGAVRVELSGRGGAELDHFRERIEQRLRDRGIRVDDVKIV